MTSFNLTADVIFPWLLINRLAMVSTGWNMASSAIPADPEKCQSLGNQEGLTRDTRSQQPGSGGFLLEIFRSGAGDGLHHLGSHCPFPSVSAWGMISRKLLRRLAEDKL